MGINLNTQVLYKFQKRNNMRKLLYVIDLFEYF